MVHIKQVKLEVTSTRNHFDDFSNMLKTAPLGIYERRAPTDVLSTKIQKGHDTILVMLQCFELVDQIS